MLEKVRHLVAELPVLMRIGLVAAVTGGVIDITHHLTADTGSAGHGSVAMTGHLITLFGMVVTMLGLFGAALTRRSEVAERTQKGELE